MVLVLSSVLHRILQYVDLLQGDVANEVETEQMVHDSGVSSLSSGHFTSFVQLRGSVPSQWSQDISKMVPKPAISFDLSDPFCETAGKVIYSLFVHCDIHSYHEGTCRRSSLFPCVMCIEIK